MRDLTLDYNGANIDNIYNMDDMSDKCILSFTGVESTERFILYVGPMKAEGDTGKFDLKYSRHPVNLHDIIRNDEVDDTQASVQARDPL